VRGFIEPDHIVLVISKLLGKSRFLPKKHQFSNFSKGFLKPFSQVSNGILRGATKTVSKTFSKTFQSNRVTTSERRASTVSAVSKPFYIFINENVIETV